MATKSLTDQEKMDAWHNGTRGLNISACKNEKILRYYKICCDSNYITEQSILLKEINLRGLKVISKNLNNLIDYITNHPKDMNNRSGADLTKTIDIVNNVIYFSWDLNTLDDLRSGNYKGFVIDTENKLIWDEHDTNILSIPINYETNMDDAFWFIDNEVFETFNLF